MSAKRKHNGFQIRLTAEIIERIKAAAEDRAEQHDEMAQEQRQQAAEAHTERENM